LGEGVPADVNMNGSTALSLSIFDFGKDLGGDDFDDRPITPAMTPEVPGVNGEANGVDGESPSDSPFNFPVYIPGLSESSGGPSLIHREP
jgi:hypothetical protein